MPCRRTKVAVTLLACALLIAGCANPAATALKRLGVEQQPTRIEGTLALSESGNASGTEIPVVLAPAGPVFLEQQPEVNCANTKCVALTFDDGPGKHTGRLLDMLAKQGAKATFYMLGQNVANYPDTLRRMVTEGLELGNHTFSHPSLTKLPADSITREINSTREIIRKATGVTPGSVRPPYGAHNASTDALSSDPLVLWDVDTLDWQHHDPKKTVEIAMEEVSAGSIILMHDIHETSVQAVPELVSSLKKEGYTLVTVDQLFEGTDFEASTAYARRTSGKKS